MLLSLGECLLQRNLLEEVSHYCFRIKNKPQCPTPADLATVASQRLLWSQQGM